jgi:hypothetical protein
VGQLEENGEYRMEMVRVVYFHIWSSKDGNPRLCRLRTASVELYGKRIDYVLAYT